MQELVQKNYSARVDIDYTIALPLGITSTYTKVSYITLSVYAYSIAVVVLHNNSSDTNCYA